MQAVTFSPGQRNPQPTMPGRWQRLQWQAGSLVLPGTTARALERLWFTPPHAPLDAASRRFLDAARGSWALVTGHGASRRVRVYRWGNHGPLVLLAHGWGGHAGQWHAVADALLAAGYRVAAYDALSHGASDAGARGAAQGSVVEMSHSLLAAAWHVGPVQAVVAHSMGGPATALALREGLPVHATVLVSSPADMPAAFSSFAWHLGAGPDLVARVRRNSEQWLGLPWSALNVPDVGRTRPVPRTLVIHDRDDREVRWEDGAAIAGAWPGAELVTTSGLGHRRILRDEDVTTRIADFLDREVAPVTREAAYAR